MCIVIWAKLFWNKVEEENTRHKLDVKMRMKSFSLFLLENTLKHIIEIDFPQIYCAITYA